MTTATLARPVDPYCCPAPSACVACGGRGCAMCDSSGWEACWVRLPDGRTERYRHAIYRPSAVKGTGKLTLRSGRTGTGKLATATYTLAEFAIDKPGRGFAVLKSGSPEAYHVFCGPQFGTCDCSGGTYLAAERANRRAWEAGAAVYDATCRHLDAVRVLLAAGWLDVEPVAEGVARG